MLTKRNGAEIGVKMGTCGVPVEEKAMAQLDDVATIPSSTIK
jgi:hypothetical protein